jgi:hypothetical protein
VYICRKITSGQKLYNLHQNAPLKDTSGNSNSSEKDSTSVSIDLPPLESFPLIEKELTLS